MFNEGGQPQHGVVCRGGKGGGGGSNPMMEYYLMQQMQQQQAQQQAASQQANTRTDPTTGQVYTDVPSYNAAVAQDKANAQATAAANESAFQQNKQAAYNAALQSAMQTFQGQGVDPNNYMSYITPALQQAAASVPDLSTNIGSYFPSSLGQTILNQATGDTRTRLMNQLNQTFTPTYSSTALPNTVMDPAVSSILSSNFDPLSSGLTNALKRGTLTQAGYNAALNKMSQDRAAAESQLRSLGQGILSGDRASLDTLAAGARSDIANATLGQNINPADYASRAGGMVSTDVSGFPGALQSAAGNVTFSDLQDLLNAGGAVQGATNPTATNPQGTGAIGAGSAPTSALPQQDDLSKRGLGNTGAF